MKTVLILVLLFAQSAMADARKQGPTPEELEHARTTNVAYHVVLNCIAKTNNIPAETIDVNASAKSYLGNSMDIHNNCVNLEMMKTGYRPAPLSYWQYQEVTNNTLARYILFLQWVIHPTPIPDK